jgi:hypothetical protein
MYAKRRRRASLYTKSNVRSQNCHESGNADSFLRRERRGQQNLLGQLIQDAPLPQDHNIGKKRTHRHKKGLCPAAAESQKHKQTGATTPRPAKHASGMYPESPAESGQRRWGSKVQNETLLDVTAAEALGNFHSTFSTWT